MPDVQTVGQSLTLQCNGTTVRGITSTVDITWRSNSVALSTSSIPTTMGDLVVYRVSYTISQLSTANDNERYNCRLTINSSPEITINNPFRLDVTGELFILILIETRHTGWRMPGFLKFWSGH